jgi:N-acetylglucosaminyl-diphospho-decaprenol L-rhamnosyltransferase
MSGPVRGTGVAGVVVVHYGAPAPTVACVRALRGDASPRERRVLVVDNSGNLSGGGFPDAEVVDGGGNNGFGAAANRGVAELGSGPFGALVILNNDVEVADGYLEAALEALRRPGVGAAAGPLYLDRPGGTLWYAGGGVNFLTGTVRQRRSPRLATLEREIGFFPGAAFAVSQDAWRATGGFDPGYFLYNEDVDLCLRLRRLGFALLFVPRMVAVHRLGSVTGSGSRSPLYLEQMTATRLRPFRPRGYRLYLAVLHSGYVLLRALRYRALVGGEAGREAARALVRGHARALAGLTGAPHVTASTGPGKPGSGRA